MPEIIDLISSPIESRTNPPQAPLPPSRIASTPNITRDIDLRDYGLSPFSDDLGFPPTVKKRKRRESLPENTPGRANPSRLFSFLSSDNDIVVLEDDKTVDTAKDQKTAAGMEVPSDPIMVSSSAPEPATVRQAAKPADISFDLENDGVDDFLSFSQPVPRTALSERTSQLLASLSTGAKEGGKAKPPHRGVKRTLAVDSASRTVVYDEVFESSSPKRTARRANPTLATRKVATKEDKEGRKADKEVERERKRVAREEKARERAFTADMAEVNKSKTDKKISTPEMLLNMPRSLQGTSIGNQVVEYMKTLQVETTFSDEQMVRAESRLKGNLIQWRRKVRAEYDEEAGHWRPLPAERIEAEKHLLLHLTAQDFLEMAVADISTDLEAAEQEKAMTRNLDRHVACLRSRHKDCKPIYLIEGLTEFLRKNKNARNRAYAAAVRSGINHPPTQSQGRRKKSNNSTNTTPTPNLLPLLVSTLHHPQTDPLLLHLHLHAKILVQHSRNAGSTSDWIRVLTQHVSTIPYRHARMRTNDPVGFCMDVGQVRTGDGRLDTFVRMLQEVRRVTPAMAGGVVAAVTTGATVAGSAGTGIGDRRGGDGEAQGSVGGLIQAFRQHGPLVLQDVPKSLNRNGGVSDRALGPAVSRRLYKVWMGRLAGSTDGIS